MSKTQPTWPEEVDKRLDSLVTLRRDFHRHPELSFEERRTSEIIAERLHSAGLEVRTGMAKTGVVGVLRGDRPGRTVAWRADTDALPLTETLEAPFASAAPGVMHACGHDGHTAIAITLAEILAARRAHRLAAVEHRAVPVERDRFAGLAVLVRPRCRSLPVFELQLARRQNAGQLRALAGRG
jgi:metal-dependent amidase/aminoacylase/carboxypeptidase family protein